MNGETFVTGTTLHITEGNENMAFAIRITHTNRSKQWKQLHTQIHRPLATHVFTTRAKNLIKIKIKIKIHDTSHCAI